MGYYKELNQVNFNIVNELLKNENLCKLIYYKESNPLDMPDFNTDILLFNGINPIAKRPDPESDKRGFINVFLYEAKPPTNNKGLRTQDFYIDVMCHNEAQIIDGGIRQYNLMNEVDSIFNGKVIEGISTQRIIDMGARLIYPSEWHIGYRMTYRMYNDANLC